MYYYTYKCTKKKLPNTCIHLNLGNMHAWFDIHSTLGMFPDFLDYSQSEQNVNMLEWEMFGHSWRSRAIGNEGDTENGGEV